MFSRELKITVWEREKVKFMTQEMQTLGPPRPLPSHLTVWWLFSSPLTPVSSTASLAADFQGPLQREPSAPPPCSAPGGKWILAYALHGGVDPECSMQQALSGLRREGKGRPGAHACLRGSGGQIRLCDLVGKQGPAHSQLPQPAVNTGKGARMLVQDHLKPAK